MFSFDTVMFKERVFEANKQKRWAEWAHPRGDVLWEERLIKWSELSSDSLGFLNEDVEDVEEVEDEEDVDVGGITLVTLLLCDGGGRGWWKTKDRTWELLPDEDDKATEATAEEEVVARGLGKVIAVWVCVRKCEELYMPRECEGLGRCSMLA